MSTSRYCFYQPATQYDENGYIPSVVYENKEGHRPLMGKGRGAMPWYWGKTLEEAEERCQKENEKLGLTREDVIDIVSSSMFKNYGK